MMAHPADTRRRSAAGSDFQLRASRKIDRQHHQRGHHVLIGIEKIVPEALQPGAVSASEPRCNKS
jgi:hypothetical protein